MSIILNQILGIQLAYAQTSSVIDKTASETQSSFTGMISFVIAQLPFWITAVLIIAGTFVLAGIAKKVAENRIASKVSEEHQEAIIVSGRIAFIVTLVVGFTIALAIAGINLTTVLAAVGFGISFGIQDTVSNFVAGITLLVTKPFGIGDWIKVAGRTGKVEEIRTRFSILKSYDGLRFVVPNATLFKSLVISYTTNATRRMKVPVYCRYGVDIEEVKKICLNEVKKDHRIYLMPKPNVIITSLEDSYITLQVRFWVDSKGLWRRIESQIYMNIQNRLQESGLDSPYPVTSLSMEQDLESVVLKTKNVDANDFASIMNERKQYEETLANRRKELLAVKFTDPVMSLAPDQGGAMFLQANGNQMLPNNFNPVFQPQTVKVDNQPTAG